MHIYSTHDKKVPAKRKVFLVLLLIALWLSAPVLTASAAATIPAADTRLLQQTYTREETLLYEIRWMGLKAGELAIQLTPDKQTPEQFSIRVKAQSTGLLEVLYPVDDNFETIVSGPDRLPTRYSIDLHEGRRRNKKLTTYDQQLGIIIYRRNEDAAEKYKISGPAYNEFSSFMIMRALPLVIGRELMVPTFADKKRHEVKVRVEAREKVKSIFGKIDSIRVRPQLPFKGLYQKTDSPVIWLSDDTARIPLKIKAKIVIGSLTAQLVEYTGWKELPAPEQATGSNDEESLL